MPQHRFHIHIDYGVVGTVSPLAQTSSLYRTGGLKGIGLEMAHGYSPLRRVRESAILMGSYGDRAQEVQG
jgi:hypothetical protein